jgi:integrase
MPDMIADYVAESAATSGAGVRWVANKESLIRMAVKLMETTTGATVETCTTGNVLATVAAIRARDGSPNYALQQISAFKRFALWLAERRPELNAKTIGAIKLPARRWKNRRPEDMLTRDEVLTVIGACTRSRDRALIAMLYDGSNRPSELLALRWGDVHRDEYGAWFSTAGKTGKPRHIRLTLALPYLAAWSADYPGGPAAGKPVFCTTGRPHRVLTKSGLDKMIAGLRKQTGIAHLSPYVFRPSRITHDVEDGYESAYVSLKNWGSLKTPMLDVYTNLSAEYLDSVALEHAGIRARATETRADPLRPIECSRCKTLNVPGANFCSTCMVPLTATAATDDETLKRLMASRPDLLIKVLQKMQDGS